MRKTAIIQKLQQLFRTDMRYLLQGSFYLSLGQISASLFGFILTLGLVRVLNPAEYGQYSYILSLASIVGIFTLTGMDSAVTQSVARGFDHMVQYGFRQKLIWSIPISIVTVSVGAYYIFQSNEILGLSLIVCGVTTPLFHAASVYSDYFGGKKQFKKLASDSLLRNIVITGSMLVAGYLTHDVLIVVLSFFISNTLISVVRYAYLVKKIVKDTPEETRIDYKSAALGKHLSFIEAISNIAIHIDKIIVFQLLGATTLAYYALALAPVKQLQGVSRIIRTLIMPKFSARTEEDIRAGMTFKLLIFFGVSCLVVLAYWITSELFFAFFFPDYADARLYSQIFSLSLLTMPMILVIQAFSSLHKKRELYIHHISKPIIKIILLLLLVPPMGMWGAIYAVILNQVIVMFIALWLFYRNSKKQ